MNLDSEQDKKGGEVMFPMPKGYTPPNSAKDGDTFTAIATFRVDDDDDKDNKKGAMLCLTKLEGVPVSKDGDKDTDEDEGPSTSPELMKALAQPEATASSTGMPAASTY